MKETERYKFKPQDKKIINIFTELGMPRNLAKTLMYILQVDECKSADIEHGADLRQPEVSVTLRELRQRGWVKKWELNKKGKGRPVHIYKSTTHLSEILRVFEQEKLKEVESVKKDILELKNIIESNCL